MASHSAYKIRVAKEAYENIFFGNPKGELLEPSATPTKLEFQNLCDNWSFVLPGLAQVYGQEKIESGEQDWSACPAANLPVRKPFPKRKPDLRDATAILTMMQDFHGPIS